METVWRVALAVGLVVLVGCGSGGSDDGSAAGGPADPSPAGATTTTEASTSRTLDPEVAADCESERRSIEIAAAAYEATYGRPPGSLVDLVGDLLKPKEFAYDLGVEGSSQAGSATVVLTLNDRGIELGCPDPAEAAAAEADRAEEAEQARTLEPACQELVDAGDPTTADGHDACLAAATPYTFTCDDGREAAVVSDAEHTWILLAGQPPTELPDGFAEADMREPCTR